MHEASIAQSLLGVVRRAVAGTNVEKIVRIELSIGRLKAIEPQLLSSCFQFMAEDTVCEGAELVISAIPVSVCCKQCDATFEVSDYRFRCEVCDSTALTIVSGSELRVERIQAI